MKTKELKGNKGITLIALVITIIVLLILAGVTIATLTGENGILTKAKEAKEASEYTRAKEAVESEVIGSFDDNGIYDVNKAKENLEKNLGAIVTINPDGTMDVYYNGYHFKVSANGEVTLVEKDNEEISGMKFDKVSSGDSYTLAIDKEGNIWGWGQNDKGEVGNGESNNTVTRPTQITSGTKYVQISAGKNFTNTSLALDNEGNIWTWGENIYGELGNGQSGADKNVLVPTKITNDIEYTQAMLGGYMTGIALDIDGNIWTWGSNSKGQLGNGQSGYSNKVLSPTKITTGTQYSKVTISDDHCLALDNEGNIWGWGSNNHGKVGNGETGYSSIVLKPTKVTTGIKYTQIAAESHSMAIDEEGNIWTWGYNAYGQLGNGEKEIDVLIPTKITTGTKYIQIVTGYYCSLALDNEGNIWTWGHNSYGQLGNGKRGSYDSAEDVLIPTKVTTETKFAQIEAGNTHNLALDTEGNIYGCGENDRGQLTFEQTKLSWIQTDAKYVTAVSGAGIDEEGNIWTWVQGNKRKKITNGIKYTQIQLNNEHYLALDSEGNIWSWGRNSNGQVGNGETQYSVSAPVQVTTEVQYTYIETGGTCSFAIDNEGNIWSWGSNNKGQLGNKASGENILTPTKVTDGIKYVQISSNGTTSFGLDENGNIWFWGYNMANNILVPTQGTNEKKYTQIEIAVDLGASCYAIDEEGNIWEMKSYGQLENGENGWTDKLIGQTQQTKNIKFTKISGKGSHLGLDNEGKLWIWGRNNSGQLGDGTSADIAEPKNIDLGIKIKDVDIEGSSSCVIDENGYMWSTGWYNLDRSTIYPKFQKLKI